METRMRKLLVALLTLTPMVAQARPVFKYKTPCALESPARHYHDTCTVVETRDDSGWLKTRNIFSNRFGLTIKMRWDEKTKRFVTWDTHNLREYHWVYKIGRVPESTEPYSYVMPGFLVESVSWD